MIPAYSLSAEDHQHESHRTREGPLGDSKGISLDESSFHRRAGWHEYCQKRRSLLVM
jgi:hypothetical protein